MAGILEKGKCDRDEKARMHLMSRGEGNENSGWCVGGQCAAVVVFRESALQTRDKWWNGNVRILCFFGFFAVSSTTEDLS